MSPDTQRSQNIDDAQNLNPSQVITLTKPAANENISLPAVVGAESILMQFESADAEINKEGNDLVFLFADGSSITITDYFVAYSQSNAPSFVMQQSSSDYVTVEASEFLLAVSPDAAAGLATAAGPAAGAAAAAGRSRPGTDGVDALVDGPADPLLELSSPGAIVDPTAPNLTLEAAGLAIDPTDPATPLIPAINVLGEARGVIIEKSGNEWMPSVEGEIINVNSITAISDGQYGTLRFDADGSPIFTAYDNINLVPGQKLEDVFTLTRTNPDGSTSIQEFKVSISGNNFNSDDVNIGNFTGAPVQDLYAKDFNGKATNITITDNVLDLGEKADNLTVGTMTGGKIDTGTGNDTMNIENLSGNQKEISVPVVKGGACADIKNMIISLGTGEDNLELSGSMTAGYIGGDFVNMKKNGDTGDNDNIIINILNADANPAINGAYNSGAVGGDAAYDMMFAVKGGNDTIHINDYQSGLVGGDAGHSMYRGSEGGNDTITIDNMFGGQLGGDAGRQMIGSEHGKVVGGNDEITITNMFGGKVAGDSGQVMAGNVLGGDDTITVTNNMTKGSVAGDAGYKMEGVAKGGDDTITVTNMAGDAKLGAIVAGDSGHTMTDDTVGGNDTINITEMTDYSKVAGDAGDTMSGSAKGGVDTIEIIKSMTNGIVAGDAGNLMKEFAEGGGDTITINEMTTNAIVAGDAGKEMEGYAKGGDDTIDVTSMSNVTSEVIVAGDAGESMNGNANGGVDKITIDTMYDGIVAGDAGKTISGNAQGGDDIINITNLFGGAVYGDARALAGDAKGGNDEITIINMTGGSVYGDAHYYNNMASSAKPSGNDQIIIGTMTGGVVYGDANYNDNSFDVVEQGGDDYIEVRQDMSNAKIYGGYGNDTVKLGGLISNSIIDGGDGQDTIIFGAYNDEIRIDGKGSIAHRNNDDAGYLVAEKGQEIVNFETINGGDGDDMIDASGYTKGGLTLIGGAGSDTILGSKDNNDTFAWSLEDLTQDATDTIINFANGDTLSFEDGITVSDYKDNEGRLEITLTGKVDDKEVSQTVIFENSSLDYLQSYINDMINYQNS